MAKRLTLSTLVMQYYLKLNMVDVCGDGVQRGEVFKVSCK